MEDGKVETLEKDMRIALERIQALEKEIKNIRYEIGYIQRKNRHMGMR
jgi:uncharacterized protein (UPF0335 family)